MNTCKIPSSFEWLINLDNVFLAKYIYINARTFTSVCATGGISTVVCFERNAWHNKRHTTFLRDVKYDERQCNTTYDNAMRHYYDIFSLMFSIGVCRIALPCVVTYVVGCIIRRVKMTCAMFGVSLCVSCLALKERHTTFYVDVVRFIFHT